MGQWREIFEDDFAAFGKRSLVFAPTDSAYRIVVDDKDQLRIRVLHGEEELDWTIHIKEVRDNVYRLQGSAYGTGSFLPADGFWFELLLTSPATITFYGDRVVFREDQEG